MNINRGFSSDRMHVGRLVGPALLLISGIMTSYFMVNTYGTMSQLLSIGLIAFVFTWFPELVLSGGLLLSSAIVAYRPELSSGVGVAGILYLVGSILLVPGFGPTPIWTGVGVLGWLFCIAWTPPAE